MKVHDKIPSNCGRLFLECCNFPQSPLAELGAWWVISLELHRTWFLLSNCQLMHPSNNLGACG